MTKSQLKVEERSLTLVDEAEAITVTNQKSMDNANDILIAIKGLRKEVADTFGPIISKAHKTHQEALAQKKKLDSPLMAAETAVKRGIVSYINEQDRKRQVEEARVEAARQDALIALKAERIESEGVADAMKDAGLGDLVFEDDTPMPEPVAQEYIPEVKLAGGHTQVRWHAELVDKELLIKAVANGQVSSEALIVNIPYLNSRATADKDTFNIPGVKAVKETSMVSKGSK